MTKILIIDIETAPSLGYVWGKWEQNVIDFSNHWYILCYAYKWLGDGETRVKSLADFKGYAKNKNSDKKLVESIWKLFDEADVIMAHNGDAFDIKKINTRFLFFGMNVPSPYKTIDTKKIAKRYFNFESNSLNDLCKYLGIGGKLETGGFETWLGCMRGDKKAWATMTKYNKMDVELLEKLYLTMRPFMTNHPTIQPHGTCPVCESSKIQKRGKSILRSGSIKPRFQCTGCGAWFYGAIERT